MEITIGKTARFCYGVKRAVEGSIYQIENNKNYKFYNEKNNYKIF